MKNSRLKIFSYFMLTILIFISCKKDIISPPIAEKKLPKADFSFIIKNPGSLPSIVEFTSISLNAGEISWNFDDGEGSSEQAPKHSYKVAKKYNVKLIVKNEGESSEITKEVIITDKKPSADFNFSIKNPGSLPSTVLFLPFITDGISYKWDFDNGTTSNAMMPEITFTNAKTYKVKLTITNQYGLDSLTKEVNVIDKKPNANFNFTIKNAGILPTTVDFHSTSTDATSYKWDFGDGNNATIENPINTFSIAKTYTVKLTTTNQYGSHEISKLINITQNEPNADFNFTITNPGVLPTAVNFTSTSIGATSYKWDFDNGNSSTSANPTTAYSSAKTYNVKLTTTNQAGSDEIIKKIMIIPNLNTYAQTYKDFGGITHNLTAWEGKNVMILSRNSTLDKIAMFRWLEVMDNVYDFYKLYTGREPIKYATTYINNRTTIADVASTCGAACGYLGFTGIEIQNSFFDAAYNSVNTLNHYDQVPFYEFGRNFWFFSDQLAYKDKDPIVTGYAIFMRYMSMEATGVTGASTAGYPSFSTIKSNVENLINTYMADPSLNWANTLGVNQGLAGTGLGATDLFASFCFRLRRDYGGDNFVRNIWKNAASRPKANTTQDAVDNFFLASCKTANKNLTTLFQSWKWPISVAAINEAKQY